MQEARKRKFAFTNEEFQPRKKVKTEPGLLTGPELAKQYVGVSYDKRRKKFTAQRYFKGKRFSGGIYDDVESAARASDDLVRKHGLRDRGHVLNFPSNSDSEDSSSSSGESTSASSSNEEEEDEEMQPAKEVSESKKDPIENDSETEDEIAQPPKIRNGLNGYNMRATYRGVQWCSNTNKWLGDLTHKSGIRFHVGYAEEPLIVAKRLNGLAQRAGFNIKDFNPHAGLPDDPREIAYIDELYDSTKTRVPQSVTESVLMKAKKDLEKEKVSQNNASSKEKPDWPICQYDGCKKPSKRNLMRSSTIPNLFICGACRSFERKHNKLVPRELRVQRKKRVQPEKPPALENPSEDSSEGKSLSAPRASRSKSPPPPKVTAESSPENTVNVQSSSEPRVNHPEPSPPKETNPLPVIETRPPIVNPLPVVANPPQIIDANLSSTERTAPPPELMNPLPLVESRSPDLANPLPLVETRPPIVDPPPRREPVPPPRREPPPPPREPPPAPPRLPPRTEPLRIPRPARKDPPAANDPRPLREQLLQKKLLEWDKKDVGTFLEYAGLKRYQKLFKSLEVDGIVLNFLDTEQAKEAGVMGIHCPKLLYKLDEFKAD